MPRKDWRSGRRMRTKYLFELAQKAVNHIITRGGGGGVNLTTNNLTHLTTAQTIPCTSGDRRER